MKILSKYKDYYDYLSGIYGEDPLVVLDRTNYTTPTIYSSIGNNINSEFITLYIGGYVVQGFHYGGKIYYGTDLLQFGTRVDTDEAISKWKRNWYLEHLKDTIGTVPDDTGSILRLKDEFRSNRGYYKSISMIPLKDSYNINEKLNCPIIVVVGDFTNIKESDANVYKNCNLKDLNLNSLISPELCYRWISDWISLQKTKAETVIDNRSDKLKIESKGFDNKTSFRPNIK